MRSQNTDCRGEKKKNNHSEIQSKKSFLGGETNTSDHITHVYDAGEGCLPKGVDELLKFLELTWLLFPSAFYTFALRFFSSSIFGKRTSSTSVQSPTWL